MLRYNAAKTTQDAARRPDVNVNAVVSCS